MATWKCEIAGRKEFQFLLKRTPELIVIWGVFHGRTGPQSLPTVMDDFSEICVGNPRGNWHVLVERRSRDRFVIAV